MQPGSFQVTQYLDRCMSSLRCEYPLSQRALQYFKRFDRVASQSVRLASEAFEKFRQMFVGLKLSTAYPVGAPTAQCKHIQKVPHPLREGMLLNRLLNAFVDGDKTRIDALLAQRPS